MTTDAFVRHYTRGRRRVAGAGAALQLHRGHRREPAAGRRGAAGDASEHRRHEGVGRRRRADRGSRVAHAGRLSACSPARRRRSTRRCASARRAASSRWPCVLPGRVRRACSSSTRRGRHDEARSRCSASWCRSRGCSARRTASPGLKAALNLLGYDVGVPRPPLAAAPEAAIAALRDALAQFEEIPA